MKERNNNSITIWGSIAGFFIVSLMGTAFHYMYGFSQGNILTGIFTPINESLREHLKLLLYPYLLYMSAEYLIFGRKIKGFVFSMTAGMLCGLILIPLCFYGYSIFTKTNIAALDILIYYLSVVIAFFISAERIISRKDEAPHKNRLAVIIIAALILIFTVLTLYSPDTALYAGA